MTESLKPSYLNDKEILNVAFYRFVDLTDLPTIQENLRTHALKLHLKGSILLSEEGINSFLAGTEESIRQFLSVLSEYPAFQGLEVKESFSSHVPFKRMLVKIKKEIITMGMPEIRPKLVTGQRLDSKILKSWLDEKKPLVLVDTRNTYEVDQGTFDRAVHYNIETFKQFPDELKKHQEDLKDKTVVMFCTGGIRCEKATALALEMGIRDVYQLEGGILKYFEETGGAHYNGDCFVFDGREAVDPNLSGAVDRSTKRHIGQIEFFFEKNDPFSEAVKAVLDWKRLPYQAIEENSSRLSARILDHLAEPSLPLLVHQGVPFTDPWVICEYLDDAFPHSPLMPKDAARRARARIWARWMESLYFSESEGDGSGEASELIKQLRYLQGAITRRNYFVSSELSLIDLYLFSFIRSLKRRRNLKLSIDLFPRLSLWYSKFENENRTPENLNAVV
jgi:UPF0176 protein